MAQLEPMKTEIERAGAQLVYIAAEKATGRVEAGEVSASHPVSFPFCWMKTGLVTKAYGLYHRIGMDAINIAHPATLVIDRDRKVSYIYRGDSQTDRAPFDQVMEAGEEIIGFRVSRFVSTGSEWRGKLCVENSGGGMKRILAMLAVVAGGRGWGANQYGSARGHGVQSQTGKHAVHFLQQGRRCVLRGGGGRSHARRERP